MSQPPGFRCGMSKHRGWPKAELSIMPVKATIRAAPGTKPSRSRGIAGWFMPGSLRRRTRRASPSFRSQFRVHAARRTHIDKNVSFPRRFSRSVPSPRPSPHPMGRGWSRSKYAAGIGLDLTTLPNGWGEGGPAPAGPGEGLLRFQRRRPGDSPPHQRNTKAAPGNQGGFSTWEPPPIAARDAVPDAGSFSQAGAATPSWRPLARRIRPG